MKHLFLRDGVVLGSRSNLVPEGIDRILRRGFVPAAELLEAVAPSAGGGRDEDWDAGVARRLLERGRISRERLRAALAVQARERLLSLAGWFDGRYACQPGVVPPSGLPEPPPLPLPFFFSELEELLLSGTVPEGSACPDSDLPSRGDLRGVGGASLFVSLALRKASGTLLIERGKRRKIFEFSGGSVVSAASSDPGETLASVLRRWRYLPVDVVARLDSAVRSRGTKFREVLLRERLLSRGEIDDAVRVLHAERVLEAFSWRSGGYEFRGEVRDETSLPPPREEPTEKEHPVVPDRLRETAAALALRFRPSPENALLVLEGSAGPAVEESLREIASIWHRGEGTRTLLVRLDPEAPSGSDPAFWSAPEEYRAHLRPGMPDGVEVLPVAPEERSPRNAEGILAYGRFVSYVNSKYDRVVWLAPPPTAGSPLFRVAPSAVFVVSPGGIGKEELGELIGRVSPAEPAGFLFRDEPVGGESFRALCSLLRFSRIRAVLRR